MNMDQGSHDHHQDAIAAHPNDPIRQADHAQLLNLIPDAHGGTVVAVHSGWTPRKTSSFWRDDVILFR